MRKPAAILLATLIAVAVVQPSSAQTFDLQLVEVLNNGTNFDVKVQIKASGSTFGLGSGNFVFVYSGNDISTPTLLQALNFSGGLYTAMTITEPISGRVSVNIEYNGSTGSGTVVPTTFLDVVTIRFTTINPNGSTTLTWRTQPPNPTNAFKDDNIEVVPTGILSGLSISPMPVQLLSFTGSFTPHGYVRLDWRTLSEINNYGFFVEKSLATPDSFFTVPNSFVPGHGTTTEPQDYSFIDSTTVVGQWYYRLKQVDLSGPVHYSDPILIDVVTSVKEAAPIEFALLQNYPNPFNPTTEIKFSVETNGRAVLELFNIIGQRVATLFDGEAEAGQYYRVRVNGHQMASGVYFYRLESGQKSTLRKMLLLK